jgi:acyl carrier protein
LSSLDTVNLMLAVEAEFAVKIPDRDMTPGNFRSVVRIDALIGRLLKSCADAPAS